jgi:heterodisulfide reductase subunit C2
MQEPSFLSEINALSEQSIQLCYHCHKCTSGCPAVGEMDYGPDQVLQMIQLGEKDRLLSSHDIWLCASCETCGTRCPNEIEISRVMDALRRMALEGKASIAEPDAVKFHRLFLMVVQNMGRMHEAILLGAYKLWTMHVLADMDSGARMIIKGKVPLMPALVKDRRAIKTIFEKTSVKRKT